MSDSLWRVNTAAPGTATTAIPATMIHRGAWHWASTCPARGSNTHTTATAPARNPRSTPEAGVAARLGRRGRIKFGLSGGRPGRRQGWLWKLREPWQSTDLPKQASTQGTPTGIGER
ncbi:hypothetical protein GCM10010095_20590 [Streptomyces anthocyanicus]|nr:hypothetical protein GCM10010095_20590 [Streptomyces anthocyanicus]